MSQQNERPALRTNLDHAYALMSKGENDQSRFAYYERLLESELFLLLEAEVTDAHIAPQTYNYEGETYVLAFDLEERLATFAKQQAPYVALSGRGLLGMLCEKKLGLGLNFDVEHAQMLLPPELVAWLKDLSEQNPKQEDKRIKGVLAPVDCDKGLISKLEQKLTMAQGLAQAAYLVTAEYENKEQQLLLTFVDALPPAQKALAQAVQELVLFSQEHSGTIDVLFMDDDALLVAHIKEVGIRFDIPKPKTPQPPAAPGTDPSRPPKLR